MLISTERRCVCGHDTFECELVMFPMKFTATCARCGHVFASELKKSNAPKPPPATRPPYDFDDESWYF